MILVTGLIAGRHLRAENSTKPTAEALIVIGASGTEEYYEDFQQWARRWKQAFSEPDRITLLEDRSLAASDKSGKMTDKQRILDWINVVPQSPDQERWLILIGHGTYQLQVAKFNLEGPDLSLDELAKALDTNPAQWRIIVCAACSGPFINVLSGPNRIVVTATKSGSEQNFSRFGDYLSQAVIAASADLDHDGSVSILEAFIMASGSTSKWYAEEGRIASEQALLDDNGDRRGTPANFFRGVRAAKAPADGLKLDGQNANRVFLRKPTEVAALSAEEQAIVAGLEQQIEELRKQKSVFAEAIYYAQLELLLVELAQKLVPANSNSTSATAQ